ncbi:piggyBac transposable element-derived protein 3-like [Diachasma alloeum]|uniref:piggyBac transposable element-derived protein 3-like n=1 Tax=Diachasma alloeum TaxID=454923 RepID=UPI0007383271|nr:piggyBac transposable element-derived protein 3-like [Diachasma alloeum]
MTHERFSLIQKYLHLADNCQMPPPDSPNFDLLYKVRPILNLAQKFKTVMNPQRGLAIDEAMIAYKGKFPTRQYMRDKPDKWGFKMWAIAESKSGYMLDISPYLGKKEVVRKELLLGEQVVLQLSEAFRDIYYHIYFDNFFTSVFLMEELLKYNIYACGTVRSNRRE